LARPGGRIETSGQSRPPPGPSRAQRGSGSPRNPGRNNGALAARLSPPDYITRELSERPSDPTQRKTWDKGVSEIERYRQDHGIKDPEHALGRERGQEHDWSREQARQRLQQRQVELQRMQARNIGREAGHSMEIGLWPLLTADCGTAPAAVNPPSGVGRCAPLTAPVAMLVWRVGRRQPQGH